MSPGHLGKRIIPIGAMSVTDRQFGPERLDSDLLRTFLAIADAGSFTRGAERVFRSQSAVSLQIKRLEDTLGQRVFERHGRGVGLTPTGETLQPLARRVVDLLDSSFAEMRCDGLQGRIRIGIPDEYGKAVLSKIIADFARGHPRVELVVQCALSTGFPAALKKGLLDIAVYEVETPPPGTDVLRQEQMVWAGSRRHVPQDRTPLPVALFDRDCWWRDRALEKLDESGRPYRVVYSSESVAGVAAAIEAGVAVGVLGASHLHDDLVILGASHGLQTMPESKIVLDHRSGQARLVAAMAEAIRTAFAR